MWLKHFFGFPKSTTPRHCHPWWSFLLLENWNCLTSLPTRVFAHIHHPQPICSQHHNQSNPFEAVVLKPGSLGLAAAAAAGELLGMRVLDFSSPIESEGLEAGSRNLFQQALLLILMPLKFWEWIVSIGAVNHSLVQLQRHPHITWHVDPSLTAHHLSLTLLLLGHTLGLGTYCSFCLECSPESQASYHTHHSSVPLHLLLCSNVTFFLTHYIFTVCLFPLECKLLESKNFVSLAPVFPGLDLCAWYTVSAQEIVGERTNKRSWNEVLPEPYQKAY